jgi:hypothetical protein
MMNRKLSLGVVAAAAMLAAGCDTDGITSVNSNPNSPENAPSGTLFTNAARQAVGRWVDGVGGTRYSFLAQHFAEVQYPESDQYVRLRASTTSVPLFNQSYNVELQDLTLVTNRGQAANQPGLWAPASVLRAWEFGILTDVFGDVPYSEAFQGDQAKLAPKYDTQQSIYADLFTKLAAASTALGTATNVLGDADPIYGGDPASWRRFANSLRARHALRLVNVDAAKANTELTAALGAAGGLILTNAQNAALEWPGDGVYDNPWAASFKTRDDFRISNRLLTYLAQYQDPRLPVYAQPAEEPEGSVAGITLQYCPTAGECYVGLYNALDHDVASPLVANTSRIGEVFFPGATAYGNFGGSGGSFPSFLMTAAEVEFIRAEAAERGIGGLTPAQAQGFYEAGIRRSMEMWSISESEITAYLARAGVAYATGGTQVQRLEQIAIQKWLALFIDPIQAWSEYRRTCEPSILDAGPEAIVDEIPRRLQYSNTEQAVNRTQYNEAVARQGADNLLTRIYWDKSPANAPTCQ